MSTNNETWYLHGDGLYWNNYNQGEITKMWWTYFTFKVHNDLGLSTTPHFCTNDNFKYFFQEKMCLL